MSLKTEAIAILTAKKDEQVASVGLVYDTMIAQIQALPEDVPVDVAELQAQLADLTTQLDNVKAAFEADEIADEAAMAEELSKEAKLQAKLDAIKAALEA